MKNIHITLFLFLLTAMVLFTSSCKKDSDPLFTMDTEARFTIPAGLNTVETFFFQIRDVPTFFDVFSSTVNLDSVEITQLIGRDCNMKPVSEAIDLDFIHSMNIFILNPSDSTDRYEIFFMDVIEFGSKNNIRLFNSVVDVQEFMRRERVDLQVEVTFRQVTFRTVEYELDMSFSAFGNQ